MLINSLEFAIVFPVVFIFYWIIPNRYNKYRNLFLLVVSYLLYMNWKPAFAFVLLGVTIITYFGGRILQLSDESEDSKNRNRKKLVWFFVLLGLLPLLAFKYYNFINDSISTGLASIGLHFSLPGLNWAIPVGISFFTFQAVGYMLDVYKGRVQAEKNILDYALFVSFFPQVTSGPISTADELMPQIRRAHTFSYDQVVSGFRLLLWGLFLKIVIADRLGLYIDTVYADVSKFPGVNCFMASVFYTIQIYSDFAGYSLLAIGIAKTLGFDLINNFERPYFAASITEFWKRWHISLTRWLTTHIYINLGGNRCSKPKQYSNILVTFLISGLWHGANWTFVIWGAIHGVLQIIEKALWGDRIKNELKQNCIKFSWARFLRIIVTFNLVNIAWIFFRMPTIGQAYEVISKITTIFSGNISFSGEGMDIIAYLPFALLPLLLFDGVKEYAPKIFSTLFGKSFIRWSIYIILIVMILLIGVVDGSQFIYVSF